MTAHICMACFKVTKRKYSNPKACSKCGARHALPFYPRQNETIARAAQRIELHIRSDFQAWALEHGLDREQLSHLSIYDAWRAQ